MKTISREDFDGFLEARPNRKFTPESCTQCPIAGYVKRKVRQAAVAVDQDTIEYSRTNELLFGGKVIKTPGWAKTFIRRVDKLAEKQEYVTGEEALTILRRVK